MFGHIVSGTRGLKFLTRPLERERVLDEKNFARLMGNGEKRAGKNFSFTLESARDK